VRKHGRIGALSVTINAYKAALEAGVWNGIGEWVEKQLSDGERDHKGIMMQLSDPDGLAMFSACAAAPP
jgi:hypothetical protein